MYKTRKLLFIALMLALSACASPTVDMSAASFNEEKYSEDLDTCRGGTAAETMLGGLGGAVVGSFWGAGHGAANGSFAGATGEGTVIGAIVGSVIGVFAGAYKPIEEQGERVRSCLVGKGYTVSS
jgi:hypothetical protein